MHAHKHHIDDVSLLGVESYSALEQLPHPTEPRIHQGKPDPDDMQ